MSNMPIKWLNALDQYSTEIAKKAWVWHAETRSKCNMHYDSDEYANEVERLALSLNPMLETARKPFSDMSDEKISDLLKFILIRHANHHLGANVKPYFLEDHV